MKRCPYGISGYRQFNVGRVARRMALMAGCLAAISAPTSAEPIKAAVLRSQGTYLLGQTIWRELNVGWDQFGKTAVSIDYTSLAGTITFQKLQATAADTLIVSCTGFLTSYSREEVDAIQAYVKSGHGIIITYDSFLNLNRNLAPLVGLSSDVQMGTGWSTLPVTIGPNVAGHSIFQGVETPYETGVRYGTTPQPYPTPWPLTTGQILADRALGTVRHEAGIIINEMPTYRGVYFGYYIEDRAHGSNQQDMHVFYNSVLWAAGLPEPSTVLLVLMATLAMTVRNRR